MSQLRLNALLALFAAGSVMGCKCKDDKLAGDGVCQGVAGVDPSHTDSCTQSAQCGDHDACSNSKDPAAGNNQCCLFADRKCTTDGDCCPGQVCNTEQKRCLDKMAECTQDSDCANGLLGQYCGPWTDAYGSTSRCQFHPCGASGECPDGLGCFQSQCLGGLPCDGICPAGKACVPSAGIGGSTGRCQDYTTPAGRPQAACPATCGPGFIATFQDNRNVWDTCNLPSVACVCAELPPLHSEDLGRFSAVAASTSANEVVVSQYDGQYGDLVVDRFSPDGKLVKVDYVDGVPKTGTVKFGPSGPRGGLTDPGDDVGRYTDVAVSGDVTYVSYYDATHGDLKLAYRSGSGGTWTLLTVDGATADVGRYTSIAVDSGGLPSIAYFQSGGSADFDVSSCPAPAPIGEKAFITALKLAQSSAKTPAAADFVVRTLACQSRPTPACYGCAQVCADPGTGAACLTPDATCTGCDPNTDVCVKVGTQAQCAKKYNPSTVTQISDGVGLFPSLGFKGKDAYLAFMRRTKGDGDLLALSVNAQGTVSAPVVIAAAGDTGYFPALAIEPGGRVAIAYHDFSTRQLRYYDSDALTENVSPEVIDTGAGPMPGQAGWVGTSTALLFPAGNTDVYAVYQDATRGDLRLARRRGTWSVLSPLKTDGAVGFFADGALLGGQIFATHARLHAQTMAGEPHVDNTLLLEKLTPP